jgi:formamidopyrimidine-DNA glycosylase
MPELPEVEMARMYLQATILHQPIRAVAVLDERILSGVSAEALELSLAGEQFISVQRHGKRLFLRLQDDLWLTLHLGLTGRLVYLQARVAEADMVEADEVEAVPSHTRLLISFQNECRLAFDDPRIFGEVGLTESPTILLAERKIGPDALQLNLDGFLEIMRGRRGAIKAMLLNQSLFAGLGNLYADESLFQAGICPRSRGLGETELIALFSSIQEVMKTALSTGANLANLPDSYLLPHRHAAGTCPRDGSLLRHEKIGGRTSYYCPKHQKTVE